MKTRIVYLVLCVVGTVLPCWQFIAWLFEQGPDPKRFLQDLFANRISTFFVLDVVISAVVLIVFVQAERLRTGIRRSWIPILATFLVGVSLGLPMFLFMRELHLDEDLQKPRGSHLS